MLTNYIERRLFGEEQPLSERECLDRGGVIVVLAEPGAGKSELLTSFARQLGVVPDRASIFRHRTTIVKSARLVIDALDEVARQDQSAVDEIIVQALELGASTVIFASRSSEWGNERTRYIESCAGKRPTVVRLLPFDEREQRSLFDSIFSGEDFDAFLAEARRFELTPVLGNPMFLRLFVEGYIQGGRHFQSKRQIFKDAIDRLASDDGKYSGSSKRPPLSEIVAAASEVFAKLLLSGATGVAIVERIGDRNFPYLPAMCHQEQASLAALNSRLFKPGADDDFHEPVHRIVAEYCAAQYLAQRLSNPADRLALRRCLALIAPNGVVRDELRGLLGWLAALGDLSLQKAVIELDPYAALANGDPAQLAAQSKRLLLARLQALSEIDPYFRRSDVWRQFNASGFFTLEVVEDVRGLLRTASDTSHLVHLILELLQGEKATEALAPELRKLILNPAQGLTTRLLARRCLAGVPDYDPNIDVPQLLQEGGPDSLNVAAEFVIDGSKPAVENVHLLDLLRRLGATPHPSGNRRSRVFESRHFITELARSLDLQTTVWLLDNLTFGLSCTCGAAKHYDCHCRSEISKIVGRLLDQYFTLASAEHDPARIWSWTRNLKFEREATTKESQAVLELRANDDLRRAIQLLPFEGQTDRDQIWETILHFRWLELHAGLGFVSGDSQALADYGFQTDNVALWSSFAYPHYRHAETKGRDAYRTRLRAQALEKPAFMREWAKLSRGWREIDRKNRWSPRYKRSERRQKEIQEANSAHLKENRTLIEQGNHWGWNQDFARRYLHFPDKMGEIVDNISTAESALANCFSLAAPHVPTLNDLASGRGGGIAEVLHAGCLVRFRRNASLEGIEDNVLRAVKTNLGSMKGYREGEGELLEAEIDSRIFRSLEDVERFAREYIEPTVLSPDGAYTTLWWLESKAMLRPLTAKLAVEWIEKYPAASLHSTEKLFDICAQHCDRSWFLDLIQRRCDEFRSLPVPSGNEEPDWRRKFWFLRHFFFAPEDRDGIWSEVLSEPDGIFALENREAHHRRDAARGWPALTAEKIFRILDAYIGVWTKVFLPSSWGTGSPKDERAYRFLKDITWQIDKNEPARTIPTIDLMLLDGRFEDFHIGLRSLKAAAVRKKGLQDFVVPTPSDVTVLLDNGGVASVEDLRALLVEELEIAQKWLKGAETDPIEMFWPSGIRVDENTARNRIVERLQGRMTALNTSVVVEHHMAKGNRCDFTASRTIDGRKHLLVCEVKGQWHPDLYTAAAAQLDRRYAIHPDAARQGIFLALWFGASEKVAGRAKHQIKTPDELHAAIVKAMPEELHGFIDVFVLDLSKT